MTQEGGERPTEELIDQSSYSLAKQFPTQIELLRDGAYDELSLIWSEEKNCFLLHAVSHKTCEEHGCDDEECRKLAHYRSFELPLPDLDKILIALFMQRVTTIFDSPLRKVS